MTNLHFQWNFQSSIWSSVSIGSSFSMKSSYHFQSICLVNHAFLKFLWISLWGHLALEKLLNMREIFNSMVKIQIFDENRKESLVNWKWLILEDSKRSFTLLFYTLMHFVKNQFWKSVRRKKTFKFNLELLLILKDISCYRFMTKLIFLPGRPAWHLAHWQRVGLINQGSWVQTAMEA